MRRTISLRISWDLEGAREVLAFRAGAQESKDGWSCLLQDLRSRGATQIDLLVTDGHEGLLAAVADLFPTTLRQRCLVHKQRNVMSAIPKREQQEVTAELTGIWKQEKKEDALLNLAASTRQIPEALSRSETEPLGRRRASFDLLCLPAGHASVYSQHQRHGKFF
jgi:transposase-like protein